MRSNFFTFLALLLSLQTSILAQQSSREAPLLVSPAEAEDHLLQRVAPTYPPLAKAARIQGLVHLEVTIDETGATRIKLISGHPMLAPAAIEAVKQWKYKPFEVNGKPAMVTTDVVISIPEHVDEADAKIEDQFQSIYWPAELAGQDALKKGDYDAARKSLLVARAAAEKRGDSKWLELAETVTELGTTELESKNYAEAERLYKQSLAMHEQHQQPDEAEVGGALQALSNVYMAQSLPEKAEPLLLRSVEIYKKRIAGAPLAEAEAAYGRHIAWGYFWLAAMATSSNRPQEAKARCTDGMQYAKYLEADQRDVMTRGCAEVLRHANQEN